MPTPMLRQDIVIDSASTTNAATATGNIDCQGYDWLTIDVTTSTSDDTTNNPSVLKISESDDTVATNFADITACVGDGTGGFTIPASVTAGEWGMKFNIDLRGRKRYLRVTVSPLTTQVITAIANLGRGDESAADTTKANVKALVNA